jgi:DNA-binding transcriptional LysR family regulator
MELRHLRYFAMVAEEENISHAAARLNISQPAVSRQIRDLEKEFGVALFDRERKGLKLTEAGQSALVHARAILMQSSGMLKAMDAFRGEGEKESLRIGYTSTALPGFLADGLKTFNERHPNVCVQIQEMTPGDQEAALQKNEIDLALLGSASPEVKKKYRVEVIKKSFLALAMPDDHPLAERKTIDLSALGNESFVILDDQAFPGKKEMTKEVLQKAGLSLGRMQIAKGFSELLGMVAGGAGLALIPESVGSLAHPRVKVIRVRKPQVSLFSSAVWSEARESNPLLAMVELLRKR